MRRITCLLLDMGGVLTQDQRQDKVASMLGVLGAPDRGSFEAAYWGHRLGYDRGSLDGRGYWGRIAAELGVSLPEETFEGLVRLDLESWFNMRPSMLAFLEAAKGRVGRLVLLSNIHVDGARYLREGGGRDWASRFDELVLSCEHGLLKPELEIYERALEAVGALPGEALFVDDSEANVAGALRAGLSSFRFVDEEDFASTIARDYELRS